MTEQARFLPQGLAGKPIGVLAAPGTLLGPDLTALGCTAVPVDPLGAGSYDEVAAFVLDCTPMLGQGYPDLVRAALDTYARIGGTRHCYAALPYVNINYNWDVTNFGAPQAGEDILPGARWTYDALLSDFAARAVANTMHENTNCIVTRLLPLSRTLMCIMATSGHGKTTFVRQLKNQHGTFHTSSDYLLNTIVSAGPGHSASPAFAQLKQAIAQIPSAQLWGRFFRLLEEDHDLLRCFLSMAWQHMQLAPASGIISFDIDLREDISKQATTAFFREKQLKVWECHTS